MADAATNNTPLPPPMVPIRVQVAPGEFTTIERPRDAVERYALVKLVLVEGVPRFVLRTLSETVRITRDLPRKLKLDVDIGTLHVLVRSGMVRGCKLTPSSTMLDVHSLVEHINNTTGERAREFWTAEKRRAYREAYDSYHSEGMTDRPRQRGRRLRRGPRPPAAAPQATPAKAADTTPDLFDFLPPSNP